MDENEITQRLREAGNRPVPGEVRGTHLTRMHAAVPTVERPKRFGRLAVAAAAVVGFTVGSTGFAMAGALPDPAQQVAHDVLSVVKVNVENPKNRGQCISAAARQHGDNEEAKQAAKDLCPKGKPDQAGQGKPDHAGEGKGKGRPDHAGTPGGPNGEGDGCKGRPPWAGKGAPEFSDQQKADFRAACGRGDDSDDAAEEADDAADAAEDAAEAEREALEQEQERQADALEEQQEAEGQQAPPVDPGADQRSQGNAPEQTPPGPPAEGAPGEQAPPVEVPTPSDDTDADAG